MGWFLDIWRSRWAEGSGDRHFLWPYFYSLALAINGLWSALELVAQSALLRVIVREGLAKPIVQMQLRCMAQNCPVLFFIKLASVHPGRRQKLYTVGNTPPLQSNRLGTVTSVSVGFEV